MSLPPYRSPEQMDASFRILTAYDIGSDSFVTRLDIRLPYPNFQFHVDLSTSKPGNSDLKTPAKGVDGCLSVRASSADLSAIFRGLADKIDMQNLEWPELSGNTPWIAEAPIGSMLRIRLPADNSDPEPVSRNDHIWRALRAAAGG